MAGAVTYTNVLPVWVVYNSRNIGFTGAGDVTVSYTPTWSDYKAHQTGNYLLNSYFAGAELTVSCTISETSPVNAAVTDTDSGYLGDAFPMGEAQNIVATDERFSFTKLADVVTNSAYVGQKATDIAQELQLIPVQNYVGSDSTETDENFVVPLAFVKENGEMLYSIDNALEVPITFHALFDPATTYGDALAVMGKLTGTWISGGLA